MTIEMKTAMKIIDESVIWLDKSMLLLTLTFNMESCTHIHCHVGFSLQTMLLTMQTPLSTDYFN